MQHNFTRLADLKDIYTGNEVGLAAYLQLANREVPKQDASTPIVLWDRIVILDADGMKAAAQHGGGKAPIDFRGYSSGLRSASNTTSDSSKESTQH